MEFLIGHHERGVTGNEDPKWLCKGRDECGKVVVDDVVLEIIPDNREPCVY